MYFLGDYNELVKKALDFGFKKRGIDGNEILLVFGSIAELYLPRPNFNQDLS